MKIRTWNNNGRSRELSPRPHEGTDGSRQTVGKRGWASPFLPCNTGEKWICDTWTEKISHFPEWASF